MLMMVILSLKLMLSGKLIFLYCLRFEFPQGIKWNSDDTNLSWVHGQVKTVLWIRIQPDQLDLAGSGSTSGNVNEPG